MALPPERFTTAADFVPLTRPPLAEALRHLGVREGDTLMVHVRLSGLRWLIGGMDAVVYALRDVVGAAGTLLAFCGWEDSPYHRALLPPAWQDAYRHIPAFDPATSSARRDFGRFPERLRTWPGAVRSGHPEVSFTALGPRADWLLEDPFDADPWGASGPLGRLVRAGGRVLLLGAPLKTMTLCHHAEAIAPVAGKRFRDYRMPVLTADGPQWRDFRTLDTYYGALPYYERADLAISSPVDRLAQQAVAAKAGVSGRVGAATGWLFEAPLVVEAVVGWLKRNF
ncbi:MAG TPA: aminoglycoside 3-N-acetyltransferase [Mycobacteriales bacterium]|jgi:aminoglycoside 3-N-acetyltransferase|nr:aminoglycoside 3-N-acetyltransferase [Mycobacteriales bacterium]